MCPTWPGHPTELRLHVVQLVVELGNNGYPMTANLQIITPCSQCWIIQTSWNWMQKSVKCDVILDFFHGKCLDLCGGQETKINTANSRGDWLRNIHLDQSTRHPEPAGQIYGGKNGWPCRPDQKSLLDNEVECD
jgi:hypothetical protein